MGNANRMLSLMMKVGATAGVVTLKIDNSAVTLGEELGTSKKDSKCECEARVRAYMRMLRVGEGTEGESGYTKLFGHKDFTKPPFSKDMSDHPRIHRPFGKTTSTAAGAYQVMGYTWDDNNMKIKRKTYGITDFTPLSQDLFCIVLFKDKRKGMLNLIIEGKIELATSKYGSYEWASLPPGRYGQPNKTMKQALALYDKYLQEELAGKSDLHLKNGFLKKFGVSCKCGEPVKTTATTVKEGYDIDAAVKYVVDNAASKSLGKCALYVRKGINAGGISGSYGDAYQYIQALPKLGFTDLGKITSFQKGDIVVFNKTGGRKYGHIAMWTGSQWVSDFKQKSIIVHSDYTGKDYHVFRWQ